MSKLMPPSAAKDGGRLGEAKTKPLNSEPRFQNTMGGCY